jgi:hypothetical protein
MNVSKIEQQAAGVRLLTVHQAVPVVVRTPR